ncbi:MAG: DUF4389 domain-containing protein [bacterium]|nr:DUF4389 domain-containing protein [bacterium]
MTVEATDLSGTGYPARLEIDYPERLSRVKTLFRIILVIPIAFIAALVSGSFVGTDTASDAANDAVSGLAVTGGVLFLATLLMLLFRRKYPRWWFDWNLELTRFTTRVGAYLVLLRDEYPSTDEQQAVHLDLDYPDAANELNRFLPIVKWILAIPHYIVLAVLGVAAVVVTVIAWFAIIFTGRYPRGMFDFVVGFTRWALRVEAYVALLITDRYPPFSLKA